MAAVIFSTRREQWSGALVALALTCLVGVALVFGLVTPTDVPAREDIARFRLAPERIDRAPRTVRTPRRDSRPSGAAASPNLRSRATELAAPVPMVPIPLPPSLVVSETPADGFQSTSGAAPVAGPGTGAGGTGDGFGGGGNGDGDGAGDRDARPPRQTGGRIRDSDYPIGLAESGVGGVVTVLYVVETDGGVPQCDVVRSSGDATLDALTCRLIRERFRFRPSRDGRGRAVPSRLRESHEWVPPVLEP